MPRNRNLLMPGTKFLVTTLVTLAIESGLVIAGIFAYFWYIQAIPYYSCESAFPELGITLRLSHYLTVDENQDTGQYLSVNTKAGHVTRMLAGYDWAHFGRRNIYETPEGNIAVLGSFSPAYRITADPVRISVINQATSDDWRYLGAFVMGRTAVGEPLLIYLDKSQVSECIAMAEEPDPTWKELPRSSYRQPDCPD